jgi:uncharacterized protein (DUF58 family)
MVSRSITSHYQPQRGPFTSIRDLTALRHAAREIDLIAISRALNPLSGLLTSKFRGRGVDFAEVRAYQPGDDVRSIDWRVTARTRKPHTRLYEEEKERPILLVVDQCRSMFFGSRVTFKSVLAAQSAALIAWTALEGGDRVGGILYADDQQTEVKPRRSKHALLKLLREMHRYNLALGAGTMESAPGALSRALASARRVCKHGAAVFVISDFQKFDSEARMHLSRLARHNDLVGLQVADPLERNLPDPNLYTITDGTQRARINTAEAAHREEYSARYAEQRTQLQREFRRLNAPLFELSTDEPVVETIANKYSEYAHAKRRAVR